MNQHTAKEMSRVPERQSSLDVAPEEYRDVSPEAQRETVSTQETLPVQQEEHFLDETIGALKQTLRKKQKRIPKIPQVRDEMTVRVEQIMEHGLADAYRSMTPIQQQQFKIKGEQTALEIRTLLRKARIKIKDIFKLLLEWIRMLPGINKFYLEQEAKIKAEKILALRHFDD